MLATKLEKGPSIHAFNPWVPSNFGTNIRDQLLSDDERVRLEKIAVIVRFKKGERIYAEGEQADAAFNVISGVVSASRATGGARLVTSFLYPGDLFGLSREGNYTSTIEAMTPVAVYKMPMLALRRILNKDADLSVDVIIKLCEELRESQRHAMFLAQKRATKRLAMFLALQESLQIARGESASEIYLPMDRSKIASYLGLTQSALSRAFQMLASKRIISMRDRRHIKVIENNAFDKLADVIPKEKTI
jgi:CRP-like cAMP-binding protein